MMRRFDISGLSALVISQYYSNTSITSGVSRAISHCVPSRHVITDSLIQPFPATVFMSIHDGGVPLGWLRDRTTPLPLDAAYQRQMLV